MMIKVLIISCTVRNGIKIWKISMMIKEFIKGINIATHEIPNLEM